MTRVVHLRLGCRWPLEATVVSLNDALDFLPNKFDTRRTGKALWRRDCKMRNLVISSLSKARHAQWGRGGPVPLTRPALPANGLGVRVSLGPKAKVEKKMLVSKIL